MPQTIRAKLLLGWMPEQEAMKHLDSCVFDPVLTDAGKRDLWQRYVAKTAAIQRECQLPDRKRYKLTEKMAINKFMKKMTGLQDGHRFRQVLKLDPSRLVIHQFYVITERATEYGNAMLDDNTRINHCLGIGLERRHLLKEDAGPNGTKVVKLPHWEFGVRPLPNGLIEISEMGRWITVYHAGQRLMLWSGYHRTYALFSQMTPEADGIAPLVTLMRDVPDAEAFLGSGSCRPLVRDAVLGARPPIFSDFFDEELFIEVNLLRQRREIHIDPATRQYRDVWANE